MKVPGLVSSARSATDLRPSLAKLSPRPCQIMRGRGVSLSSSLVRMGRTDELMRDTVVRREMNVVRRGILEMAGIVVQALRETRNCASR